jgi:hypothetical protein
LQNTLKSYIIRKNSPALGGLFFNKLAESVVSAPDYGAGGAILPEKIAATRIT